MIIDIKLLDGHWPVSDEARRLKEGGFTNSNFWRDTYFVILSFPTIFKWPLFIHTEVIIRHNIYRMILQNRTFFLRMNNAPLNSLVSCTTITKPVFTSDLVPFTTNRLPHLLSTQLTVDTYLAASLLSTDISQLPLAVCPLHQTRN